MTQFFRNSPWFFLWCLLKARRFFFFFFFLQFWEGTRGPFRLVKLGGKPLSWEICYSAQLCHFWSIKKQISYHTYFCRQKIEGEIRFNGSRLSLCGDWMKIPTFKKNIYQIMPLGPKLSPPQVSPGTWPYSNRYIYVSFKQNSGEPFRVTWPSCFYLCSQLNVGCFLGVFHWFISVSLTMMISKKLANLSALLPLNHRFGDLDPNFKVTIWQKLSNLSQNLLVCSHRSR